MDNKSAGTVELGKSVAVTGWNGGFSISIGGLVTNTVTTAIKRNAYVDEVLGVELEKYKVPVTCWNGGSSISIGYLSITTGTAALCDSLAVSIGDV